MTDQSGKTATSVAVIVYVVAFVVGTIVMSFEMLGSRYLNPYFGSGIYTWASLISTVLAALCIGYFLGGWLADRTPSLTVLGVTVIIGSAYILLRAGCSPSGCWNRCWPASTTCGPAVSSPRSRSCSFR